MSTTDTYQNRIEAIRDGAIVLPVTVGEPPANPNEAARDGFISALHEFHRAGVICRFEIKQFVREYDRRHPRPRRRRRRAGQ